ncbi:MAG: aldose 1-epimerase family protein [Bacteroidales bacterium]|nr:aldose 1-epimerase family protein [Bacteroidales bacterium]
MADSSQISLTVAPCGAELTGLRRAGKDYMWNADKRFWGRVAPILFPAVGRPAEDTLRIGGKAFSMRQHGFARDVDFERVAGNADGSGLWRYVQTEPRDNYPYRFTLEAAYVLEGDTVSCRWTVRNDDTETMYFQIGAHPAFLLPDFRENDAIHGYIRCFDQAGNAFVPKMRSTLEDGLRVSIAPTPVPTDEDGLIVLTDTTWKNDAFIIEDGAVSAAALLDKNKREVLRVACPQAEAFGLWAPFKPGCPFVCLEPWCGIADRSGFTGDISQRDCIHALAPGEEFLFRYDIVIK